MVEVFPKRYACPVIEGVNIDYKKLSGSESVTVNAGASTTVTITHEALDVAGSPEVSVDNTNLTLEVKNVQSSSFEVVVTNSSTASQSGTVSWKRNGLNIVLENLP